MSTLSVARESGGYERWCHRTERPLLVLAGLFLVVLVTPVVVEDLPAWAAATFTVLNVGIWAAFALDYVARLALAPDRRSFVRRNIPDLLVVVLPILRPLRALRVLRVVRVVTASTLLARRSRRSLQARTTAFVGMGVLLLAGTAGVVVVDLERGAEGANITSLPDGLWWAATTVTTVGYGDRFPVTDAGRLTGVLLMLGGIALLGVLTASIAAWFVRRFAAVEELEQAVDAEAAVTAAALAEMTERLERMERLLTEVAAHLPAAPIVPAPRT